MIKRDQIDNLLERVNNNLEYYYSNIQKIAVCKGQKGYAIEVSSLAADHACRHIVRVMIVDEK